jgi:hypothetical protein
MHGECGATKRRQPQFGALRNIFDTCLPEFSTTSCWPQPFGLTTLAVRWPQSLLSDRLLELIVKNAYSRGEEWNETYL